MLAWEPDGRDGVREGPLGASAHFSHEASLNAASLLFLIVTTLFIPRFAPPFRDRSAHDFHSCSLGRFAQLPRWLLIPHSGTRLRHLRRFQGPRWLP